MAAHQLHARRRDDLVANIGPRDHRDERQAGTETIFGTGTTL
jgi:hypothetical protein